MSMTARQEAIEAVQIAHRHLTTARKLLSGIRIPMGGFHYDFDSALKELRVVQERTAEAIQLIERDATKGALSTT